ncbi:GrpB family protein [uncultured Maricaulis sp.]|uniref:GrpB family protein n=1 Tax=uncultured Maricaulis sp. TaxID=174710 RepID=UPI0030DC2956|tara:strand:+ start:22619 stop:23134 length:516 start_codon:yes stop_codon:yes gene_type:complete
MVLMLVAHDPGWAARYQDEAGHIQSALGVNAVALHHIGSTAIPNILAKPVIDMLAGVTRIEAVDDCTDAMARVGYEAKGEFGLAGRRYFRKTDGRGQRTHHLHVYDHESPDFQRHLAFRDYLRAFPEHARRYSVLKAGLLADPDIGRQDYQTAKGPLVAELQQQALAWVKA